MPGALWHSGRAGGDIRRTRRRGIVGAMSKLNLNNWAQFAEIVSAAAVVLSLLYVGFELRRTTVQSNTDVQAELLSYTTQRRYLIIENGDLADLVARGYENPGDLTAGELIRFQNYSELLYVAWERAVFSRDTGVFSGEDFGLWDAWFVSTARKAPDFVWPMVRNSQDWTPSFVQHVDAVLMKGKPKK